MHYNFIRLHEALRTTPAVALGVPDRVWMLGDLLDAALATQPINPVDTPAKRRSRFQGNSRRLVRVNERRVQCSASDRFWPVPWALSAASNLSDADCLTGPLFR